ncbi:minor tail protein [Arthrobacter phage Lilmac1015]|uniref:Minor tail protein n=1 Tax=Arthrobacter phage Lilmac1015 TaxID=2912653 RepID=A0AA49GZV2_9CAUD|nr:minor tail protein [Arthrobacter phage Lilmac1015]
MATTLDASGRLLGIRVSGKQFNLDMVEAAEEVSLSLSKEAVTEMSFTFADNQDSGVFRSGVLSQGASVTYGEWRMVVEDIDLKPGPIGPSLEVKAPSRFVTALRKQTGAKSWGRTDVSAWVRNIAKSVGMTSVVQPGLGAQTILRKAPDGETRENTWDVLAELSKTTGTWLFEYGSTLVFARPTWLVGGAWGNRQYDLVYNGWDSYSEALAGMPSYGNHPSAEPRESLSFGLISPDADRIRPGDEVNLSGRAVGASAGKWIVTGVDFPLTVDAPVEVSAQRPINPKIEPPRTTPSSSSPGATGRTPASRSRSSSGPLVAAGGGSAVDRWAASVDGRYIDMDGAFGAQCVDLAIHYNLRAVGGPSINGNGRDWFANGRASGAYEAYAVGGAHGETAGKGDIACWGPSWGGGWGHVAIVLADNGSTLTVMSQNPGPARRMNLGKNGLQGYLRPKRFL